MIKDLEAMRANLPTPYAVVRSIKRLWLVWEEQFELDYPGLYSFH